MRRKSERNKSKGSPEKKVEKTATRKSTRRRGKRSTSSSPERDDDEGGKSTEIIKPDESSNSNVPPKDPTISQPATRLKIKELKTITEQQPQQEEQNEEEKQRQQQQQQQQQQEQEEKETASVKLINTVSEPVAEKTGETVEEGGSVWKVARADASPGEIQKLKLCRQRNPSEASDGSTSRKKTHNQKSSSLFSYESCEGDGDEGDSTEELIKFKKFKEDFIKSEGKDDPSSSDNPRAQDLKEEVSHCSEVLPRNTTTNSSSSSSSSEKFNLLLSDDRDKKNLDQITESNESNQANLNQDEDTRRDTIALVNNEPGSSGDDSRDVKEEKNIVKIEEKKEEKEEEEEGKEGKEEKDQAEIIQRESPPVETETVVVKKDETPESEEKDKKESSADEDKCRRESPQPSESLPQINRAGVRNLRRKHRSKYRESSDSDTPESEDESRDKKNEGEKTLVEDDKAPENIESGSPPSEERLAVEKEEENDAVGNNEAEEKAANSGTEDGSSKSTGYKPPKVNLKRSFSARLAEVEETPKKEDVDKNGEIENSALQVKENNVTQDDTEGKQLPRKRRWGTTTTTVTTEVVPAFTVSTDSLKVLVPGAKPLSITEVRLSKDDDEEKTKRRDREKRYSVGEDNAEKKNRDDGSAAKNDESKKGELKHDNHIGAKRKISILKEIPRVKSPSPSLDKATDVLLIKNLVRPFTLNQIKELLSRTGTIVENGFWIDGIKSKCYVVYANEDQAFETRQALHGISWPVSNPKRLQVEYATKEDMELARELSKDQPVQRKAEPLVGGDNWQQVWSREDKQNVAVKVTTVREWDLGKEDGHQVKEKEREKKDLDKKRRQRSRSPTIEQHLPPPARKFKKKEDEPPPAKLLDDLFKKTRAIPCIYWLPLTNEQIVVKEEMRRQHMAEHARRLEEMKRAERSRDPGSRRRRSPRK